MRIQNNITAENSHRQLGVNTKNISSNTEKLSSGFRVNRAADDAAGLAISEKMRTQIRGLNRASLNIQDGVSLLQVGDGALQFVHDIMQRMRELSVQAANDTNQLLDREAIQLEFGQLSSEVNSIVSQTNFNGRLLFNGDIGASWEYKLGKITTPFTTTIPAGNDFLAPVSVPGWTTPGAFGVQSTRPNLGLIAEATGLPRDGVFAMQIVTPANGTLNVVMNFAETNANGELDGDRDLTDFLAYFRDEFNRLSNNMGIGDIVDNIRFVSDQIRFEFPNDGGILTGAMGRQPNPPVTSPFPDAARPRVHIGLGGGMPQAVDALNGNSSAAFPGPFTSNRPAGSPPLVAADFRNMDIVNSSFTGVPPAGARAIAPGTPAGADFPTVTITVNGTPTTVQLTPGIFPDVESFVDANRRAFETAMPRGFDLNIDEVTGRLYLTTISHSETEPPVSMTINPLALATALGFGTAPAIRHEREPGGSLWIQSGANEGDGIHIEIPRLCTRSLGLSIRRPEDTRLPEDGGFEHLTELGADGYATVANVTGDPMEYSLDVTSHEKASNALVILTNAINIISTERARIGSQQNRLEFAMSNVDNTSENLQAAESRIRDVDMAAEMTMFVQNQILQQSSTAMLAQANALPQGILQLLG